MIPASYLFKNVYHQHWEETPRPAVPPAHNPRHIDGLMSAIASAMSAVFTRRPSLHHRPLGHHLQ